MIIDLGDSKVAIITIAPEHLTIVNGFTLTTTYEVGKYY